MAQKARLLVVEDEAAIRSGLVDVFVYHGYEVETADNGADGLRLGLSGKFDMILLDVMLPGVDGFEICNRIRQRDRQQPVIMLTAKSSDEDIVQGLTLGADDYVAKPFLLEELILRIHGIFRRQNWYSSAPDEQEVFSFSGNEVNFRTYEATTGERTVRLTEKECMLMKLLVERRNQVVSREEILERVWGYRFSTSSRTIDNFIVRLRRYFETDPKSPQFIHSVRGVGYRFTPLT